LGRASREFKDAMNGVQREIEQSMQTPPPSQQPQKNVENPVTLEKNGG